MSRSHRFVAALIACAFAGCVAVRTIPSTTIKTSVVDYVSKKPVAGAKIYGFLGSAWGNKKFGPFASDSEGRVTIVIQEEHVVVSSAEFLDNDSRFAPTFYCEADGYQQSGVTMQTQSLEAIKSGFMPPWIMIPNPRPLE